MKNLSLIIIFLAFAALYPTCSDEQHSATAGYITVKGDEEILPMMTDQAYAFMDQYLKAKILVLDGGSNYGLVSIFTDSAQIAFTTRQISADEAARAKSGMFDVHEFKIAKDGLAIIVNPLNPVGELTVAEVRKIFAGKIASWSKVNGPNLPIKVYIWDETGGNFNYFADSILAGEKYSPRSEKISYTEALVRKVYQEPGAIGMVSMSRLYRTWSPLIEESRIRALAISPAADSPAVLPDEVTVHNGTYPFIRYIFLYTAREPKGLDAGFITYIMANPGQRIIVSNGLVPVSVPVKYRDSL